MMTNTETQTTKTTPEDPHRDNCRKPYWEIQREDRATGEKQYKCYSCGRQYRIKPNERPVFLNER